MIAQLDAFLNARILAASDPAPWWRVKIRAKRLLAHAPDPEQLASRMLAILRRRQQSYPFAA